MTQQSSYGAIPTSEHEANSFQNPAMEQSKLAKTRHEVGEVLESKRAHVIILALTALDVLLVIIQIAATLLGLDEHKGAQEALEIIAHISLAIVTFFVVEIFLKIYAFGPSYFWTGNPHGLLHLADALIIIVSFLLEITLKGAEQELGSLLIIFRLWRLIKLTGTVAIETTEHHQEHILRLEIRISELEAQLQESQQEVQRLRAHTADQV
ncbi:hypothetical protein BGX21_002953 [Mortierella sp. AD011]|nr:hypothetical protein BGX20_002659 [Mortierella sp. AD010]KAF9401005.1 hypothetical protein BGX21_002953 [Mortierella sp. AD011]